MKINLQAPESPDKAPGGMEMQELRDAHNSRRSARKALLAEELEIHEEITRREHAEAALRMNPNHSLDQVVRGK